MQLCHTAYAATMVSSLNGDLLPQIQNWVGKGKNKITPKKMKQPYVKFVGELKDHLAPLRTVFKKGGGCRNFVTAEQLGLLVNKLLCETRVKYDVSVNPVMPGQPLDMPNITQGAYDQDLLPDWKSSIQAWLQKGDEKDLTS